MARRDKKNRTCVCCGKTLCSPHKLLQHYESNKNQCTLQLPPEHSSEPEQLPVDQPLEQSQDYVPNNQVPDQLQGQPEDMPDIEDEEEFKADPGSSTSREG